MFMSIVVISSEEVKRVLEVKSFYINNLGRRCTIDVLARSAAMSRERFRECFLIVMGVSFWDYAREVRMQTGYFLLIHSDKPIKEIAFVTGFTSSENFSTAFRKFFQKTPAEIRRAK